MDLIEQIEGWTRAMVDATVVVLGEYIDHHVQEEGRDLPAAEVGARRRRASCAGKRELMATLAAKAT